MSRLIITLDACNSSILPILSLSCANVGRISRSCSQQSLMMVYMSRGQFCGCSIRWPSLRKSSNCSVGKVGYGVPPSVKISHKQTPKDQLKDWTQHYFTVFQVIWTNIGPKNDHLLQFLPCRRLHGVIVGYFCSRSCRHTRIALYNVSTPPFQPSASPPLPRAADMAWTWRVLAWHLTLFLHDTLLWVHVSIQVYK